MTALDDTREDTGPVPESVPETGPPAEGVLGRRYRALTLGIVSCVLLIAFEATAVNTAMPVAADHLDGLSLYGFAFSGFFTTSLFAMAVSGQWCDRQGPLAPMFTGIAAFGAGLVVSGSAQSMWAFVLGRGVQGLGGGLVIVALYVVVGRAYPERLRPAVLASFSSAWIVPAIVGPVVSGSVTEHLGWRWVFLAIPALVLLPLAVMLPALRKLDPVGGAPQPVDRRRIGLALAAAVGAALLQYAGQERTWIALVPAAAGVALLVPSILRLLPRGTFRAARGLPAVILLRGIAAGSFLAAESFVPLMLVSQRGMSVTLAGASLAGGGVSWALGSYLQARPRLERFRVPLITVGMVLVALSVAGSALVLVPAVPAVAVALSWTVGGFGMGLVVSSASVLLLKLSPPQDAGRNSASLQVCDALGNILLVAACGVLFAALGGGSVTVHAVPGADVVPGHPAAFAAVLLSMTGVALVGAAVTARLRPKSIPVPD